MPPADTLSTQQHVPLEVATLAAGCFWCVEAVFQQLRGVVSVVSGYAGGSVENPTYSQVCTGQTGHAEACQIRFDPSRISYEQLLDVFWKTHDPTTLNRQGADAGTQYRSAIFYHSPEQQQLAERSKHQLQASGIWPDTIVTEIEPLSAFYPAEDYHHNYYQSHPRQPYCQAVIRPKLQKFRKAFANAPELRTPADACEN